MDTSLPLEGCLLIATVLRSSVDSDDPVCDAIASSAQAILGSCCPYLVLGMTDSIGSLFGRMKPMKYLMGGYALIRHANQ